MADISILDPSAVAVPKAYTIAGAQEIVLKGVSASYDGTGAGGSFVPAVQVVDPSGHVVGTYTLSQTLAAGASADISWFPGVSASTAAAGTTIGFEHNDVLVANEENADFEDSATVTWTLTDDAANNRVKISAAAAGGGGGGIQFATEPQSGTWLDWETTSTDANGWGGTIKNTHGLLIEGTDGQANATLDIEQTTAHTGVGYEAVIVNADDGGLASNQVTAIQAATAMSGTSGSPNGVGVDASCRISGNGSGQAIGLAALGTSSSGNGAVFGATIEADGHNGDAIGLDLIATTSGTGKRVPLRITNLPTSAAGLTAGMVWNNAGVLNIV